MNFFSRYKKIFFLLGFLSASILIGFLLWKTFFTGEFGPQASQDNQTNFGGNLPGAGDGSGQIIDGTTGGQIPGNENITDQNKPGSNDQLIPGRENASISQIANGGITSAKNVSNAPIISPSLSSNAIQYYNEFDGKFYRLDSSGNIKEISDKSFPNVNNVIWSPDNKKAVLEYPDGTKSIYNFDTKNQVLLPAHWKEFSFSPDSTKISTKSLGQDPDSRYLITANDDGSKARAIEYIGLNDQDVQVSWSPNNQVAATYVKGVDFDRKEVFFVGFNGENMKSMIVQGRGFESQWSTNGDKMLYSVYNTNNGLKPKLWIAETENGNIGSITKGISLETWASKCTFATNNDVYCAVPKSLPEGAGLYPEVADQTADNLYKINLKTGAKNLIATPQGDFTISQVIVTANQDKLYFTDKQTGQLYQVRLK